MGKKKQRNPDWQRDELILALDLYFRHRPSTISQSHPEVVALSELLNALPIHPERPDAARFRNPNGVYMKLCNFLRFDPGYQGKGLRAGNRLEEEVWKEFGADKELLRKVAAAIRAGYLLDEAAHQVDEEDEESFPEGKVLYRLHRTRERNRKLVARAKQRALDMTARLDCAACSFNFADKYGEIGRGYIHCHHTSPVSEFVEGHATKVEDLALVCPNCHGIVHRRRPWLTMGQLGAIVAAQADRGGV
jgi:5-methylcytosine-specific restriction protein A